MATPAPNLDPGSEGRAGIAWMVLTTFFWVGSDALVKYLARSYPVLQVLWARYAFHAILLAVVIGRRLGPALVTPHWGRQLVRSSITVVSTACFFFALKTVPVADANAVFALTPVLVTAASVPLLGEHVGPRRWAGVAVGFAGAVIVIRPAIGMVEAGMLLALASSFVASLYQTMTRLLSRTDSTLTIVVYTPVVGVLVTTAIAPLVWASPDAAGWSLMVLLGVCSGCGHTCMIKAYAASPASTVSPFGYTSLVWATLLGYLVFGDLPDAWTMAGALLITGSGLYIFHRERLLVRETVAGAPGGGTSPRD